MPLSKINTFVENPLLLFMDNIAPIVSVKAAKDIGKIVELSDTGCDARLPVSNALRNAERHCSPKLPKIAPGESRKSYCNERIENNLHGERFHTQNERNAVDTDEFYCIPRKDETSRQCWQKHSPYEDSAGNAEFIRKSDRRNLGPKLRISPDRLKTNYSRQNANPYELLSNIDRYDHTSARQYVSNDGCTLRKDSQFQAYPTGTKTPVPGSKYARFNYANLDSKMNEHDVIPDREKPVHTRQDYSEDCQPKEIYRDRYQRTNVSARNDADNLIDEMLQRNQRFCKGYHPRGGRMSGSPKSSDVSRDWDDTSAGRIRSRTCSPPTDRRKRTKSFAKIDYEDEDQSQSDQNPEAVRNSEFASRDDSRFTAERNTSCSYPMEGAKRYVDRAVDKDSLSDMQSVCTSTEKLSDSPAQNPEAQNSFDRVGNIVRTTFWEFIPLDSDDGDQNDKKVQGDKKVGYPYQRQVPLGSNNHPLTKRLSRDSDGSPLTVKKKPALKGNENCESIPVEASANLKSYDDSLQPTKAQNVSQAANHRNRSFVNSSSNKLLPIANEAKLNSNQTERSRVAASNIRSSLKIAENLSNQEQNRYGFKGHGKIGSKLMFGWTNKTSRYLKRPGGSSKTDSSDDKKKKITNSVDSSSIKANIVERTAACLKRKLDKVKMEEVSATLNRLPTIMQKKIKSEDLAGSRLPIRIGNRLRSRNPSARNRIKAYVAKERKNETGTRNLPEDSGDRITSVRSRTKPKIKPSVVLSEIIDNAVNFQSIINVSNDGAGNSLEASLKEKSRLTENRVKENLVHCAEPKENSTKFLEVEKLEVGTDLKDGEVEKLKIADVKGEQTKKSGTNRNYGRETNEKNDLKKDVAGGISRIGYKEKCCFHLDDEENIVCNGYCNKEHENINAFRSRKSTAIRSQF